MKNWYIEITWSIEGSPHGGWQETNQSTRFMRGTAQDVLEWLTAELAAGKQPLSFRAMPFEVSPMRGVEGVRQFLEQQR